MSQSASQNTLNLHNRPGLDIEGNYNELFLNRLRLHRSKNVILFNLAETDDLRVDTVSQQYIDEQEVKTILDYIEDDGMNLRGKIVEVTRLGRKSENRIRPVRIRFENEYYRNVAVMNGFRIKYIDSDLKMVKICKDLIRDDREKAKIEYERKKQIRLSETNQENRTGAANLNQTPPTLGNENSQGATGGEQAAPRLGEQTNIT